MRQQTESSKHVNPQDLVGIPLNELDLEILKEQLDSPHKIAIARMLALGISPSRSSTTSTGTGTTNANESSIPGGLASPLVEILSQSIDEWMHSFTSTKEEKKESSSSTPSSYEYCYIANSNETRTLHQVLSLHLQLSKADATLGQEMARGCGSHKHLTKLIRMDIYAILSNINTCTCTCTQEQYEKEEDALVEIQDLACEIAHSDPSIGYPVKMSPYTIEELHARLPLIFDVCSPNGNRECLMVRQVTERQSAQEDVGFVMWPSAVVLSSWLLDNQSLLEGKSVLEIGSGCGLTGLVAARIAKRIGMKDDSSNVILSDFNHKVLTNIDRNIELNGLGHVAKPLHLDFYLQEGTNREGGWIGTELHLVVENEGLASKQPAVDLILAADTICKPSDSVAVSNTIHDALVPGGEAIVVSANAKHRFGIDIFEKECERNGLQVITTNVADMCDGKLLPICKDSEDPCGIRQTSGFVDGMSLTMFRVRKPL